MSYFVCGLRIDADVCERLTGLLAETAPPRVRQQSLRIGERPFLALYGHRRAIPHVMLESEDRRSWVAILGTPLVTLPRDRRHDPVAAFFADPERMLREVIDGQFALIAFDASSGRLMAATDLNNTTPMFVAAHDGGVLLCSHELPLARLLRPSIDPNGFSQAIQLGVTWGSQTRFRGIAKLLPGQILRAVAGEPWSWSTYWRPADERPWTGTFDDQADRWGAQLSAGVLRYYERSSRRAVVADFTGGEDSRLIVAQCHALGIPFRAHVKGTPGDPDVVVAERAAKQAGFPLLTRSRHHLTTACLLEDATRIALRNDGYLDYFKACSDYATDLAEPLDDYGVVKYCGFPGGEAFRGCYYLRGKALFPTLRRAVDHRFFTRIKYLLDYHGGLLRLPAADFLDRLYAEVAESLRDVSHGPIGTQIDHLLRVFQTCCTGLMYKDPLYLPLATAPMTRSIYGLSPRLKRGGRLTKACTERLFPELAFVRTQNGIPTVRRTLRRQPAFVPEYVALARTVVRGTAGRLLKWTPSHAWQHRPDYTADVFTTLVGVSPYRDWFASADRMVTGDLYDGNALEQLLAGARAGACRRVPTLGRILGQEIAIRWVYNMGVA